ncbi:hypothetical protein C1H46_009586 [Malus baccata]|uniref:Uncharacterized protein n=1 Tax=Malus baccata TaxID=106549 RepID=A0A540N2G4_MALBA|nr:hypothetical protein C1H46_009586 [Malus baccata]
MPTTLLLHTKELAANSSEKLDVMCTLTSQSSHVTESEWVLFCPSNTSVSERTGSRKLSAYALSFQLKEKSTHHRWTAVLLNHNVSLSTTDNCQQDDQQKNEAPAHDINCLTKKVQSRQ